MNVLQAIPLKYAVAAFYKLVGYAIAKMATCFILRTEMFIIHSFQIILRFYPAEHDVFNEIWILIQIADANVHMGLAVCEMKLRLA